MTTQILERVLDRIGDVASSMSLLLDERAELDAFIRVYRRFEIAEEAGLASSSADARAAEPELDLAPPAEPNSPATAFEKVGGYPVAAAPFNAEETGDHDETETNIEVEGAGPVAAAANTPPAPSSPISEPAVQTLPPSEEEPKQTSSEPPPGEANAASPKPPRKLADQLLAEAITRVVASHAEHPDWTITRAADELGIKRSNVAKWSKTKGLVWAQKEPAAEQTEPAVEPPLDAAAAGEESPPLLPGTSTILNKDGSAKVIPYRFGGPGVVHTATKRGPRGAMFYLVNDEGAYLHQSGFSMVPSTKWAWKGTEAQLVACRRSFSLARDLRERAVEL